MAYRQWYYVINPRSGGRSGGAIAMRLRALVGAGRVCDLIEGDVGGLLTTAAAAAQPVVVIGGDGSAAGVMNLIAERGLAVTVAVLPVGTGNDLSRFLGLAHWDERRLEAALEHLGTFAVAGLDRWRLRGPGIDVCWYNYCSFGADARIAYHFHDMRERHPGWFRTASVNRAWYGAVGAVDRPRSLRRALSGRLAAALPAGARSLVLANINSYAGGTCLSRRIDANDGRFELMTLPDGLPLVLRLKHLRPARLVAQTGSLCITAHEALHLQVDGEAQIARPGVYTIAAAGSVAVLAKGGKDRTLGVPQETAAVASGG